jgi:hypothetical protein
MKTRLLSLALLALSAAVAKDFTISLYQPAVVAGKSLPAGEYKVAVRGDTAIISHGKDKVESPVKVVESDRKYSSTTVRCDTENGRNTIQEIQVSGTKTRLVFEGMEAPMAGGESTKANP